MGWISARVTKDGLVHYRAVVRLKGARPQCATFERKTDALKWVQKVEAAIRENRHFDSAQARRRTFASIVDEYLANFAPVRHRNKLARRAVECHLKWWREELGHHVMTDIKPADIARLRDRLLASPAYDRYGNARLDGDGKPKRKSSSTVVRYLASLSVLYTTAVNEWGLVDNNPVLRVKRPSEPRGRMRFLDDSERDALLDACKKSQNPYLYPIVVLALSTGARHGEILNVRWKHVDFARRYIRLDQTKNNERRALPLAGLSLQLIKELHHEGRKGSDFVFPNINGSRPVHIETAWKKALNEAGIEDFRFHDLRHSAASYLAMNGATLAEIAEVLGHKTLQMVKRYAHISEQHTAKVVARMNEQIFKTTDNNEQQEKG